MTPEYVPKTLRPEGSIRVKLERPIVVLEAAVLEHLVPCLYEDGTVERGHVPSARGRGQIHGDGRQLQSRRLRREGLQGGVVADHEVAVAREDPHAVLVLAQHHLGLRAMGQHDAEAEHRRPMHRAVEAPRVPSGGVDARRVARLPEARQVALPHPERVEGHLRPVARLDLLAEQRRLEDCLNVQELEASGEVLAVALASSA
mmetsp:Transcript_52672/g.171238  ORF Transcript_52672/g.171238 Transcript_52672/m.171238 type:complete len:202 (-) Transcript_52672:1441-2046(-)